MYFPESNFNSSSFISKKLGRISWHDLKRLYLIHRTYELWGFNCYDYNLWHWNSSCSWEDGRLAFAVILRGSLPETSESPTHRPQQRTMSGETRQPNRSQGGGFNLRRLCTLQNFIPCVVSIIEERGFFKNPCFTRNMTLSLSISCHFSPSRERSEQKPGQCALLLRLALPLGCCGWPIWFVSCSLLISWGHWGAFVLSPCHDGF